MSGQRTDIAARVAAVKERASIAAVVGGAVKLARGNRGKCPFHGSNSDSLAVYPDSGRAKCWGCGWSGDAIEFVRDHFGLDFMGALQRLEADLGLSAGDGTDRLAPRPVHRDREPHRQALPEAVPSGEVARHLIATSVADHDAVRTWLRARRVPEAALAERLLADLRFHPAAPVRAWALGKGPDSVAKAPAMVAVMRKVVESDGRRSLRACGAHVTYLSPGLTTKMNRKRSDGTVMPARKMYGDAHRALVLLGRYAPDCPLFVGEGIETTLSGMALCEAGADACGTAVLSLDNLQGRALMKRMRDAGRTVMALPLHAPEPDPGALPLCFAHAGPVTGLIDADMKPLRGPIDRETGEPRGLPVIEWPGGPVVWRAITGLERSRICAALFAESWRTAGVRRVRAIIPAVGHDFNDEAREKVG